MNQIASKKRTINLSYLFIGLMLLCSSLVGVLPQNLISLAIMLSLVGLFFTDSIYLAYPFMLFYNELYGLFLGVSLYRIFTFIFLVSILIKFDVKKKVSFSKFLPIVVYLLFCIAVLSEIGIQSAVFAFVDVICVALFTSVLLDKEKAKKFFVVYTLVCFIAFLTGVALGISMDYSTTDIEMYRFMATFEDPNYMGMFYTIAVFAIVSLKLFLPKIRVIIVILLYAMILSSLSVTAIIVNIALWLVYLLITEKLRLRTAFIVCGVAVILVGLYYYGLENPDTPVLGGLSYRLEEKLIMAETGDIGGVTTGRTDLTEEHLEYFNNLPFLKKLLGGTSANTKFVIPELGKAAHNEYVDMLLNVGIIGTVILLGYMIVRTCKYFIEYKKTKDNQYLFVFMYKFIWILYATSLTMFIDHRFMMPFFI